MDYIIFQASEETGKGMMILMVETTGDGAIEEEEATEEVIGMIDLYCISVSVRYIICY